MKTVTAYIKRPKGMYLQDLSVTEDEVKYIKELIAWVRSVRYGSLEFKRSDGTIDVIASNRKRTKLSS